MLLEIEYKYFSNVCNEILPTLLSLTFIVLKQWQSNKIPSHHRISEDFCSYNPRVYNGH